MAANEYASIYDSDRSLLLAAWSGDKNEVGENGNAFSFFFENKYNNQHKLVLSIYLWFFCDSLLTGWNIVLPLAHIKVRGLACIKVRGLACSYQSAGSSLLISKCGV